MLGLLCWGAILTLLVAVNPNLGWQAVGSFGAGMSVFLLARHLGGSSASEAAYAGLCGTVLILIILVLLEAYGVIPFISEPGRRPGATLGNRNLAARVVCLSIPLFWRQLVLVEAAIKQRIVAGIVALAIVVIVVSRSRGVWLMTAALVIALPALSLLLPEVRSIQSINARVRLWAASIGLAVAAALIIPNRLGWESQDFLRSARSSLEYQSGTGRGRVIQAETTLRMIRAAPWGIGPGNWPVIYPAYAVPGDPSISASAFYPAPRVPRSDAVSLTAEFGSLGLAIALLSVIGFLRRATSMMQTGNVRAQCSGIMVLSVGTSVALLGLVEPVLRVAPTLALAALVTGLAMGEAARFDPHRSTLNTWRSAPNALVAACACASIFFAAGSLRDIAALRTLRSARTIVDLYRAVRLAPHNAEARMLLAYVLVGANRCDLAEPHLTRAIQLQPLSGTARHLSAQCAKRRR